MVTGVILTEAALRLKSTITVLSAVAAGSALFATGGGASAAQEDSATGGGQVNVSTDGGGPGDTIAFTAKGTAAVAKGQLQHVDRADDGTKLVEHGDVTCIEAGTANRDMDPEDEGYAKIEGVWRSGERTGERFALYIEDNGEGGAASDDVVMLTDGDTSPACDFSGPDNDDPRILLARGNAQVRPAPDQS